MYLHKTFKIPIYGCELQFHIVDNIAKKAKAICKKEKEELTSTEDSGALMFSFHSHTYYIILHQDSVNFYFLHHELSHLIDQILLDRNINDVEARAYLQGWLAQEIHNYLKIKDIKVL